MMKVKMQKRIEDYNCDDAEDKNEENIHSSYITRLFGMFCSIYKFYAQLGPFCTSCIYCGFQICSEIYEVTFFVWKKE